jgi:hypothetical protein
MSTKIIRLKNILFRPDDQWKVELTRAAPEANHPANKAALADHGAAALDDLDHLGKCKMRQGGQPVLGLLGRKLPTVIGEEFLPMIKAVEVTWFMEAFTYLGQFWVAIHEPPVATGKATASMPGVEDISHGKKEVKNENPTPHPPLGG